MSRTSSLLLRIALAFAFLYPAYGFWKHADTWIGYIPSVLKNADILVRMGISQNILLLLIAGFHILIALWLLSGWRLLIPLLISAVFLGSIVYFNFNQLDVLFRDISLALVALALAFAPKDRY
ncbi:MAG: hypothetical protein Q7R64_02015 [bacterium]|nr:hypothetical protein [bacterium]